MIHWYVLLEKVPVLLALYRSMGTEKQKMITFLSNDFKTDRWRQAAINNAYKLVSLKDYIMATAFFMLGGAFEDAITVVVNNLGDLMLAIMLCRIKESPYSKSIDDKPILKKLVQTHLIEKGEAMKDPWLVSIGYTMLGKHINSLNCFATISDLE